MPESVEDIQRKSWTSDDAVPDYVREAVEEAIDSGAVWDRFESIERELGERFHDIREQLEDLLRDNLTSSDGWSLGDVTDDIQETFGNVSEAEAETVARSETASVLNTAREEGYENQPDSADFHYKWVGPDDSRTTDACERLKEATNPDYGGTPVTMMELKRAEEKIQGEEFPNLDYREHMLHPNERHTFRRVLPHELQRIDGVDGTAKSIPEASGECEHADDVDYVAVVEKMSAVAKARTSREEAVEAAVGEPVPRLLNRLLGEHGGSKRPALRDLNERLDEAGVETNVSPNTFYNWESKYRLDERSYATYGSS